MLESIANQHLKGWLDGVVVLLKPDSVRLCDGSETEKEELTAQALKTGELVELNQEKLPGCYYHRTASNDVARTEHLTFICTTDRQNAGPTNNWMSPEDAKAKVGALFDGAMKGRTMYIMPYVMGPIGSPYAKIGVEVTDSIYVVLNMRIMTRMGAKALEMLGDSNNFNRGMHSKGDLSVDRRFILHFPEENTIWSIGSGYGGNVLLSKKCLSLRIASFLGRKEGWLAEHMLIVGIEDPNGKVTYVAAAFPSACGKTNLAMMVPPESMKGYKIWTVGDDIAWMNIGKDGRLYAINPENGFFGVVPGTNMKTNPNAMLTMQKNTIYTNVVLNPEDKTIWWEGHDESAPEKALDWQGNEWMPETLDADGKKVKGAHPNSRFTAPASQCPCISPNWEAPEGVPISAIIFGGRRAKTAPLVYQSRDWQHGVYVGATMASERTAAQYGKQGELRYDPMAMLPFCGYNMAEYFKYWLEFGKRMTNPPKIFHVNWFRQGDGGNFLWPGFGENLRAIEWVVNRCNMAADSTKSGDNADETSIGFVPKASALNTSGLEISQENLAELLRVDKEEWLQEVENRNEFFKQFGEDLPKEIKEEQEKLKKNLG
ncbi:MAG: phosphoenolpyruvate carboxykinase, phosphoenolpyruvate carboxykinase (GTP) [Candidatus Peregrinibacteria bacterium GW2011_GWF2_38_29]|nr:MAG: phosphoenolpyruvate carboxykinase, phosphoenolpyruvate carboxykinase (GTP) [Candidatus Peregrinibacteria bacterium GW2011_GWF2_38_29]HBB02833.1 phosphoenolpyruvate carboxykinase (GTP) [Candidatus Peregrinibacteria bacterium]